MCTPSAKVLRSRARGDLLALVIKISIGYEENGGLLETRNDYGLRSHSQIRG